MDWLKKHIKKILIATGIIGVVLATGVGGNGEILYAMFNDQRIEFPYIDDNSNENIIIDIGTVLAVGVSPAGVSFENLPNVAKEKGLYRVSFDKWSDVEIKDQDMPEVKLRKWGEETFIRISYPDFTPATPKQDKGKLKWINGNKEVHLYPLEPREFEENGQTVRQLQGGGFEFEIILNEDPRPTKTGDYKLVLNIETKGLKFYYQRELTQQEKDGGAFRPENVIGSYAVYHKMQDKVLKTEAEGEKYKAGIFGMFYRPQMEDANGWKVWGEQEIAIDKNGNGKQTITIPQDFLDNAVYPIRHATGDNFGFEDIGGTPQDGDNRISGSVFTLSEAGIGDTLSIYTDFPSANLWKAGIYRHSNLSFVDSIPEFGGGQLWYTDDLEDPELTADDYILVGWAHRNNPGAPTMRYNDGDGTIQGHYQSLDYSDNSGVFPDTMSVTHEDRKYSIYATYIPPATDVIPVGYQEWSTSTSVSYASGTDLTAATSTAVELDLSKPTSHSSTSTDDIYWGLGVPTGIEAGTYSGTNTFEAKAD